MLLVRSVETDRFLFPLDSKRWSKVRRFIIVLFLFLFLEAFNAADPSGAQNACNTWAATMSGETGRPGMLYYFLIFSFNFHLSPPLQYIMVTHFLLAKCFFFFYIVREKEGFSSNLQEKNNKILFIMLNGALSTNDLWEACQLHLPLIVVLVFGRDRKVSFLTIKLPGGGLDSSLSHL